MRDVILNCGYVPLVDCAPLIIAKALNFASQEGVSLNLLRQPSWSALRDLLALGHLDIAHMLSPLPVAMSLGLGGLAGQVDALMVLSINGDAMGVSSDLAEKMRATGWDTNYANPVGTATAMVSVLDRPLRIGVPFPFSMHTLLTRYLLKDHTGAFDIHTVPPSLMANAIADGEVDAFCVGEPWGSITIEQKIGELVLPGSSIWAFAPEKVLGARRDWIDANPGPVRAVMRAVYRASAWLAQADNKPLAAETLSQREYLDIPVDIIDRALAGRLSPRAASLGVHVPNFLRFHGAAASFPWRSQAAWIATQLAAVNGLDRRASVQLAQQCFRSDIYRQTMSGIGVDLPGASSKVEGALRHPTAVASTNGHMILGPDAFFDGALFDFDGAN